jgi:type VI protein secretion system component Hcp
MIKCTVEFEGLPATDGFSQHGNIEVVAESYSWGISHAHDPWPEFRGGGTGGYQISEFSMTIRTGTVSPVLMLACAHGSRVPLVNVTVADEQDSEGILRFELKECWLSSFQYQYYRSPDGSAPTQPPLDQNSIRFHTIGMQYQSGSSKSASQGIVSAEIGGTFRA